MILFNQEESDLTEEITIMQMCHLVAIFGVNGNGSTHNQIKFLPRGVGEIIACYAYKRKRLKKFVVLLPALVLYRSYK